MKKTWPAALISLFSFILVGCEAPSTDSGTTGTITSDSNQQSTDGQDSVFSDTNQTDTSDTNPSIEESHQEGKQKEITIFSFNDVHGSLVESPYHGELGLAKLDYAIRHDVDYDPETSIIINCGDAWQGGYLAHEDKRLTNVLLEQMKIDAFVLGNHEFDWGIENIEIQKQAAKFPFLGINIFNDKGQYATNLADPSVIVEKGGIKVGIIGAMGPGEESSIAASQLAGYSFSDDIKLITNEAKKLKQQGCDLVILGCHDSAEGFLYNVAYSTSIDEIQAMFGAHTHQFEAQLLPNSIPYVQGGSNSRGYCKIKIDVETKKTISYRYESCYGKYHNTPEENLNQDMIHTIDEAKSKFDGTTELCKLDGEFNRYEELNRFVPMALHDVAVDNGWKGENKIIGLHNLSGIRSDLPSGSLTKELLFKTSPFDNKVKVIKNVPGIKLANLIGTVNDNHSTKFYAYYIENDISFSSRQTYDVVTIDFVSEGTYWERYGLNQYEQFELDKNQGSTIYMFDCLVKFIVLYKQANNTDTFHAADFR